MFLRFISSKISFSITVEPLWAALDVLSIFYKSINNIKDYVLKTN